MKNTLQTLITRQMPTYTKVVSLFLLAFLLSIFVEAQTNVALNKRATQSSNYSSTSGQPGNAVDGNTDGRWSSDQSPIPKEAMGRQMHGGLSTWEKYIRSVKYKFGIVPTVAKIDWIILEY